MKDKIVEPVEYVEKVEPEKIEAPSPTEEIKKHLEKKQMRSDH